MTVSVTNYCSNKPTVASIKLIVNVLGAANDIKDGPFASLVVFGK